MFCQYIFFSVEFNKFLLSFDVNQEAENGSHKQQQKKNIWTLGHFTKPTYVTHNLGEEIVTNKKFTKNFLRLCSGRLDFTQQVYNSALKRE